LAKEKPQTMTDEKPDRAWELKLRSIDHSWDWFKSHADQRLTITRFAILILGAIGAGIGFLERDHEYFFGMLLSIFGVISAYCFLKLDERTSELIKIGEAALIEQQQFMAKETGFSLLEMNKKADANSIAAKQRNSIVPHSYKQVFMMMFRSVCVIYIISAVYFFFKWI
jgi:hypothetical protein